VRINRKASSLVKLIKKAEREKTEASAPSTTNTTSSWSSAVRGWVRDFQSGQRVERLPAFDSLFKDART